jgi:hypothetical protein
MVAADDTIFITVGDDLKNIKLVAGDNVAVLKIIEGDDGETFYRDFKNFCSAAEAAEFTHLQLDGDIVAAADREEGVYPFWLLIRMGELFSEIRGLSSVLILVPHGTVISFKLAIFFREFWAWFRPENYKLYIPPELPTFGELTLYDCRDIPNTTIKIRVGNPLADDDTIIPVWNQLADVVPNLPAGNIRKAFEYEYSAGDPRNAIFCEVLRTLPRPEGKYDIFKVHVGRLFIITLLDHMLYGMPVQKFPHASFEVKSVLHLNSCSMSSTTLLLILERFSRETEKCFGGVGYLKITGLTITDATSTFWATLWKAVVNLVESNKTLTRLYIGEINVISESPLEAADFLFDAFDDAINYHNDVMDCCIIQKANAKGNHLVFNRL